MGKRTYPLLRPPDVTRSSVAIDEDEQARGELPGGITKATLQFAGLHDPISHHYSQTQSGSKEVEVRHVYQLIKLSRQVLYALARKHIDTEPETKLSCFTQAPLLSKAFP